MQTCARVLNEAEAALFEGSPLPSLVSGHLATCDTCRGEVSELTLLFGALGSTPTVVASPDMNATLTAAVLADVATRRRSSSIASRLLRPMTVAATSFGYALILAVSLGTGFIVSAMVVAQVPDSSTTVDVPTPTKVPSSVAPSAPATIAPAESEAPASAAPTPTPAPTDLPRRTPEPASPTPSGVPSTDASGSTSP